MTVIWFSGAVFGFWLAKWDVPIAGFIVLIAIGFGYATTRFLERQLDANSAKYEAFARGLEGERLIGWKLDGLDDTWHVFHGLMLREKQDMDHVVVGPGGLFYIQTKNWRGRIFRQGEQLRLNERPVTRDVDRVQKQAMELKDRLTKETGAPVRWVKAILVSPFAWVDVKGDFKNVAVLYAGELLDHIEHQKQEFDRAQVQSYVEALERLAARPPLSDLPMTTSARAA